jgi:hypothetical protein
VLLLATTLSSNTLRAQVRPLPGGQNRSSQGAGQWGPQGGTGQGTQRGPNTPARDPLRPNQPLADEPETPFFGEGTEVDPADDSVKKRRPKRPLESYHFTNEQRAALNMAWTIDPLTNNIHPGRIDSIQPDFQNEYQFMKQGVGSAWLGNLGAPTAALSYFDRPTGRDNSFAEPWKTYLRTTETMPFYNTKLAFSQLGYSWAGRKDLQEEDLVVIHAQNISPQTGLNLDYRSLGTKGIYTWQGTRNKTFSAGINHTGKRWTMHAGYIHNQVYNQENGGLVDDDHIIIGINRYNGTMRNVPVRMKGTRNTVRGNTFFLTQSLAIPMIRPGDDDFTIADRPVVILGHSFEYDRWKKRYEDSYDGTIYKAEDHNSQPLPYYESWYFNPEASRDSLFEGRLSNRIFVQLQPWDRQGVVGTIDAGVGMDALRYYNFNIGQYLTGVDDTAVRENHYYIYGGATGHLSRFFDWRAHLKLHPMGDRSGDTEAGGEVTARLFIKERPLSVSGRVRFYSQEPSYWEQKYSSNHYLWKNSFSKENETRIEGSLSIPHVGLTATVSQSVVGNKIYYAADNNGIVGPRQAADPVSVTGVYLREDLSIKLGAASSINLNHRAMLQWSTNQKVVSVPMASVYLSYFYEFNVVRDVLKLQVGVDGRYNTAYYAPGYNPGMGQLYNQREKQLGDYIWLDAFVNAKWKRMRILVKMQHLSDDMFNSRNSFQVLHYPMNRRVLKLGLSWNFYD